MAAFLLQLIGLHPASAAGTTSETTGGPTNTWTNYTNAGGTQGPTIGSFSTVQIACKLTGFRVADGNTWWYQIASSPWNGVFYASADAFYNNGATSGSLHGTPFVDPTVPDCGSGGLPETTGGAANTWTDYTNAGGTQGATIGGGTSVRITCKLSGFRVEDGNTWWYEVASAPWNNTYYVSADAFYNNGATSGSLRGTPFVDTNVPDCGSAPPTAPTGPGETAGGVANTWSDYSSGGGTHGPSVGAGATVQIACKVNGLRVADGNTWWYQIASSPWNNQFYVSADAFYNNGATSGPLKGTPYVDPAVPDCSPSTATRPSGETTGGSTNTWGNYSHAGGTQGPTIGSGTTVQVACRVTGFAVANGNTWWYLVSSAPWSSVFYASADAFYNNGATSGSLAGTPFVDASVPICSNNQEQPLFSTAVGTSRAAVAAHGCVSGNYPVNCASGDFWHAFTDVTISGRGPGLHLSRTYNALSAGTAGSFGYGWASSLDENLAVGTDGSLTVKLEDGSTLTAQPDGSGGFLLPSWTGSTIQRNGDGTFTLTRLGTQLTVFTADGKLSRLQDLNGNVTALGYDATGRLVSETDGAGRVLSLSTGSSGLITTATDPLGRVTTYSYDAVSNLTQVTDPLGRKTTFSYDGAHRLLTMVDPVGATVTNAYDDQGRITAQTDPVGLRTTYAYTGDNYSSLGGTTTVTDPYGVVELQQYANGFLARLVKASGTTAEATWTYTYDPATLGQLTATDPNGHTTSHTYNGTGQITSTTDPLGHVSSTTYNTLSESLTTTAPSGRTTTRSYDISGNLLSVTDPAGNRTSYDHTDAGHPGDVTRTTDPEGRVVDATYDTQGDAISISAHPAAGTANTATSVFDVAGQLICQASGTATAAGVGCPAASAPRVPGTSTRAYDAAGQLRAVTDPLGHVTSFSYDAAGNQTGVTAPGGEATTTAYDGDHRVTGVTAGAGGSAPATTGHQYDLAPGSTNCPSVAGAVSCTAVVNPRGGVDVTTLDPLGRTIKEIAADGQATAYTYDPVGNRTTLTNALGQVTSWAYDAADRNTSISYSDGTTPNVSYVYDNDDRRTAMADGTGTGQYTYDMVGRLSTASQGSGATVTYEYDRSGKITSIGYPNGQAVQRRYDGAGQLVAVVDWLGHTSTFTYDANGNPVGTSYPNGDAVASSFDANDALTSTGVSSSTGSLAFLNDTRTADGQILSETGTGALSASTSYVYDTRSQLGSVNGSAFGYDAAGNLTSAPTSGGTLTRSYNAADELLQATLGTSTTTYGYDAAGRRITTSSSSGLGDAFAYNQAGRLTSVTRTSPPPSITSVAPLVVSASGGTLVTLSGSGLTGATGVTFGELPGSEVSVSSDTKLTVLAPAHAAGVVDIQVTTPAGTSSPVAGDRLTFQGVPTVTTVAPALGALAGGTKVTLSGAGFTGATQVLVGAAPATSVVVVSPTQITAITPPGTAGPKSVSVTTPQGVSAAAAGATFTYTSKASVTGLTPRAGPLAGGKTVTLTGSGFTGASSVAFGAIHAKSFVVVSDTKITAVTPAHAAGSVDVIVTTPQGGSAAVAADHYAYQAAPKLTSLAPTSGSTAGGTTVTLTGTGLLGTSQVLFGTHAATRVTVISATKLTAVAPAGTTGAVSVYITTLSGKSAASAKYTYKQAAAAAVAGVAASAPSGTATSVIGTYAYDGDGLRTSETSGNSSLSFVWDTTGSVPVVLTDGARFYLYGPGGLPIEQIDTAGTPSYYFHNGIGSTRALLDSSGAVGATFTDSAYGAPTTTTGTLTTPLRFARSYSDPLTGLLYLVNRYYDPITAAFITVDPDVATTGARYNYAGGDPINSLDANGLSWYNPFSWSSRTRNNVGSALGQVPFLGLGISIGHTGGLYLVAGYTCITEGWSSRDCDDSNYEAGVSGLWTASDVAENLVAGPAKVTLEVLNGVHTAVEVVGNNGGTGTAYAPGRPNSATQSSGSGCGPAAQASRQSTAILQPAWGGLQ